MKSGSCWLISLDTRLALPCLARRFGGACRFHHPPQYGVVLNRQGLPLRPGQPACQFFVRTGACKFGAACKWDHLK